MTNRRRRSAAPAAPALRTFLFDVGYLNTSFQWYALRREDGRFAMDRSKGDVRRLLVRADAVASVDCSKLEYLSDAEQDAANKALGF